MTTGFDSALAGLSAHDLKLLSDTVDVRVAQTDFRSFTGGLQTVDQQRGKIRAWPSFDKYTYIGDLDDWYVAHRVGLVGKSRQLFASYYFMTRMLWNAWRSYMSSGIAYEAAVVSKRLDDALKQMLRIRQMYHSMPEPWQRANPLKSETTEKIVFENGAIIQAYPASENIGHSLSFTEVLLDEGARLPFAQQMWGGLLPTIGEQGRLYNVSTPNGELNHFHDLWHHTDLPKFRLHYSMHPHRKVGWKEKMKPIIDPTDNGTWGRNQELEFGTMEGEAVYKHFRDHIHVEKIKFTPGKNTIINRGFDFGYRHPACLWSWVNPAGQLCFLKEHAPVNTDIFDFVERVVEISKGFFPGCGFRNFPDPAGKQRWQSAGRSGERCAIDVLGTFGITDCEFTDLGIDAGLDLVRLQLKLRKDKHPGMLVDEECEILIKAMKGGYHYPEKAVADDKPFKDHFYDDVADAARYTVAGLNYKLIEEPARRSKDQNETYVDFKKMLEV